MVWSSKSLVKELKYLHEEGVTTDNLRISDRAHVILPPYRLIVWGRSKVTIGTTIKESALPMVVQSARVGIRIADLLDKDIFRERLERNLAEKKPPL